MKVGIGRRTIAAITVCTLALVTATTALACKPIATINCVPATLTESGSIAASMSFDRMPAGSTAFVNAHVEGGTNGVSVDKVLYADGETFVSAKDVQFKAGESLPLNYTFINHASGNVRVVVDDYIVKSATGKVISVSKYRKVLLENTITCSPPVAPPIEITPPVAVTIEVPGPTVYVNVPVPGPTVYVNVPVPGPTITKTKIVKVHVTKYKHDKARFTCAPGDSKSVVYKKATHTWYGMCYHKVAKPNGVNG